MTTSSQPPTLLDKPSPRKTTSFVTAVSTFILLLVLYRLFTASSQDPFSDQNYAPLDSVKGATLNPFSVNEGNPAAAALHPAMWGTSMEDGQVRCDLCPRRCVIKPGDSGPCLTRANQDGNLFTLTYGQTGISKALVGRDDYPVTLAGFAGDEWLTVGLVGCPLRCSFCAGGDIVQMDPRMLVTSRLTPEWIVDQAVALGNLPLVFTYSEPTNNFEFTLDVLRLGKERGLITLLSTSGYVSLDPIRALAPYVDGVIVGLKAFSEKGYRRLTSGDLATVMAATELFFDLNVEVELHYLIIPGFNDSESELLQLSHWIQTRFDNSVPLHILPFIPRFKMESLPPAPPAAVYGAMDLLRDSGVAFVFPYLAILNFDWIHSAEELASTLDPVLCPRCGASLWEIHATGSRPEVKVGLRGDECAECGLKMPGIPAVMARETPDH